MVYPISWWKRWKLKIKIMFDPILRLFGKSYILNDEEVEELLKPKIDSNKPKINKG